MEWFKEYQLKKDKLLRGLSLAFQLLIEHNNKAKAENNKIRAMNTMMIMKMKKISNFDKMKRLNLKSLISNLIDKEGITAKIYLQSTFNSKKLKKTA